MNDRTRRDWRQATAMHATLSEILRTTSTCAPCHDLIARDFEADQSPGEIHVHLSAELAIDRDRVQRQIGNERLTLPVQRGSRTVAVRQILTATVEVP